MLGCASIHHQGIAELQAEVHLSSTATVDEVLIVTAHFRNVDILLLSLSYMETSLKVPSDVRRGVYKMAASFSIALIELCIAEVQFATVDVVSNVVQLLKPTNIVVPTCMRPWHTVSGSAAAHFCQRHRQTNTFSKAC